MAGRVPTNWCATDGRALRQTLVALLALPVFLSLVAPGTIAAETGAAPWNRAFGRTWSRSDLSVASYGVERTWIWGPRAITAGLQEPYFDATSGARTVQYFDKAQIGKTYGGLATLGNVYRAPHDLVENRMAGIPAVLSESLYESNPTERQIILDDATHEAFGLALQRAVDQYFSRE